MTTVEAVYQIALILVQLWYDPDVPFPRQADAYHLVCEITRNTLNMKEESYSRAIIERDATVKLCEHFNLGSPE